MLPEPDRRRMKLGNASHSRDIRTEKEAAYECCRDYSSLFPLKCQKAFIIFPSRESNKRPRKERTRPWMEPEQALQSTFTPSTSDSQPALSMCTQAFTFKGTRKEKLWQETKDHPIHWLESNVPRQRRGRGLGHRTYTTTNYFILLNSMIIYYGRWNSMITALSPRHQGHRSQKRLGTLPGHETDFFVLTSIQNEIRATCGSKKVWSLVKCNPIFLRQTPNIDLRH